MCPQTLREGIPAEGAEAQASLADTSAVLNNFPPDGDEEIKQAYCRLLSQHHADKRVTKGLPEEMMKLAAERTHQIRLAYERIC